jgi:hypothetical protein
MKMKDGLWLCNRFHNLEEIILYFFVIFYLRSRLKFRTLNAARIIGQKGSSGLCWSEFSAWTAGHAFWREAISPPTCRVAQYLGLKLGMQIDQSVDSPIPNIEHHQRFRHASKISPRAKTHGRFKRGAKHQFDAGLAQLWGAKLEVWFLRL